MNDDIKPWDILIDAAQRIDSYAEEYCCEAINVAARELRLIGYFVVDLSKACQCAMDAFWLLAPRSDMKLFEEWWLDYSADSQAERVLALLFAAEISKDQWK